MSFWQCEKCGGTPGVTWCCTDKSMTANTETEQLHQLLELVLTELDRKSIPFAYMQEIDRKGKAFIEQAARRAPAAPVPQGWKLVPEWPTVEMSVAGDDVYREDGPDVFSSNTIYTRMLAAAPQPPEADHIPDAGKMDTNVRNWMNAALSKDVACPACGLSGLHACPSASTAESQGADAVKALEKVLRAVQRHLPPERIGERETIAEIISIVDPWPLAKPPANET